MAFNNTFTAVVGATYTAAQYNTYVRDNLTAVWVYTTAGDIVYATSATALARLGKPSIDSVLSMGNSGVPSWLDKNTIGGLKGYYCLSTTTELTTSLTFFTDIFNTSIDVSTTSTVFVFWAGSAAISGNYNYAGVFRVGIDGNYQTDDTALPHTYAGQYIPISGFWYASVLAGSRSLKLQFKSQNSATTVYFLGGYIMAIGLR